MREIAKTAAAVLAALIVYGFLHEMFLKHAHKKMSGDKENDNEK